MTLQDNDRFSAALGKMALQFSDQLNQARIALYWECFAPEASIDEWEYACFTARQRETFHKLPLPAVLWTYVQEYRRTQLATARQIAEAERLALEASPAWQAEQAQHRAKAEEQQRLQQEYHAWLVEQPRDVRMALGHLNPPDPSRWLPLTEDFSPDRRRRAYEPHGGALRRLITPETDDDREED